MAKKQPSKPGRAGKPPPQRPQKKEARGLTALQAAFVNHYVVEKNATEAAKKAGYSEKTASQLGYQLLQIPSVRAAISEVFSRQNERLELRADRVLLELKRLAFGRLKDVAEYSDNTIELLSSQNLDDDAAALMKSITISRSESSGESGDSTSYSLSFAMHDKTKALEMLAKHFKLLTETMDIKLKVGLEELIAGSNDAGAEED